MDEKHIQQVLKIEKQAQEIHEAALKEAQQLPLIAEQESQALIEKAKADAQQKAREMVSKVQADDESARIFPRLEFGPYAIPQDNLLSFVPYTP